MAEYIAPRGTKDVLPQESPKWQYVESKFREICSLYNIKELRTPTFEHTELFTRNLGETTDVVSKEMYTFSTKGDKSLTLRPEGTAPAIRAYVQNNLGEVSPLTKIYYIARLFRYERPQAGRYREHTQLGIEAIGSQDPSIDAEIISLAVNFFKSIKLDKFELKLNSIGCPECRPKYREALVEFASNHIDSLCATCAQRYKLNPMRMLDCKEAKCKKTLSNAPKLSDYLGEECKSHFEKVQEYLNALGIKYVLDSTLVRGFDYYTKTAFEFVSGELGAQNAVGGGGRYDNMVEEIGGKSTPAIGFGLGLERLMLTLDAMDIEIPVQSIPTVYIAIMGEKARNGAVKLANELRNCGVSVEVDYTGRSLKAQMKSVNKIGAKYALILGDDEIDNSQATLRDMTTSEQSTVPFDKLVEKLV